MDKLIPRVGEFGNLWHRRIAWAVAGYLALIALVAWMGGRWADRQALSQASRAAQIAADTRASLLVSELQKYRLLPVVLAEQPEVVRALARSADTDAATTLLNHKLEGIAAQLGNPIIYLLDADGRAVAASNWRLPTSFVGQEYNFRPYFARAMQRGGDEFFGLGTVSHVPGLFLSRRVGKHDGVIVVKFVFDAIERGWGPPPDLVYVTGADGVILLANKPEWRFATTHALPRAQRQEMRSIRQYGAAPLLPLSLHPANGALLDAGTGASYAAAQVSVPVPGWTLTALEPLSPIRAAYLATARLALLAAAILLLIPLALWLRARGNAELASAMRRMLEQEVASRTAELEAAQTRFRDSREALAHANRLGSIGQITAAVAHEINQPVAAIRTLSENGSELLRRGNTASANANLETIARLTTRIGTITAELRTYARRGTGTVRTIPLDDAVDGALLLVGHVLRQTGIVLALASAKGVLVVADPIRLEQILVNLLHNAIDALADRPSPRIAITIDANDQNVRLHVLDDGAGIPAPMRDRLFEPFATAKPDGLGLGLGIAREIAREFGGELDVAAPPHGWSTAFLLTLRRA